MDSVSSLPVSMMITGGGNINPGPHEKKTREGNHVPDKTKEVIIDQKRFHSLVESQIEAINHRNEMVKSANSVAAKTYNKIMDINISNANNFKGQILNTSV